MWSDRTQAGSMLADRSADWRLAAQWLANSGDQVDRRMAAGKRQAGWGLPDWKLANLIEAGWWLANCKFPDLLAKEAKLTGWCLSGCKLADWRLAYFDRVICHLRLQIPQQRLRGHLLSVLIGMGPPPTWIKWERNKRPGLAYEWVTDDGNEVQVWKWMVKLMWNEVITWQMMGGEPAGAHLVAGP